MFCEKCMKKIATFHYSEVINGVKNEHHLCAECAANTDVSYYSNLFDDGQQFAKLFSGILGSIVSSGEIGEIRQEKNQVTGICCPNCGMSYGEFCKNSAFGCPECYDVFGLMISDKIRKIQGSDTHIGKKPAAYTSDKKTNKNENTQINETEENKESTVRIEVLERKLKEAIEIEDFEEAARLRDKIKVMKEDGKNA